MAKCFVLASLLLVASASAGLHRGTKRSNSWYAPAARTAEAAIVKLTELLRLSTPTRFVYNMHNLKDKLDMVDALWRSEWAEGVGTLFTDANPDLTYLLEEQRLDGADADPRFRAVQGQSRWEATLVALFRARSMNIVPIATAAMSVVWLYYRVPHPVWDAARYFGSHVMCHSWTEETCDLAVLRDPGPEYAVAAGITAAVFDNFQMKVNYGGFSVGGVTGTKIEMTNWASVFMPASFMPAGFTCARHTPPAPPHAT